MNSNNSNVWYLDRGKNFFTEDGEDFFKTMISIFNTYANDKNSMEFNIIDEFPNKYKKSGNSAALLTTIRNIGIIDKENKLAKNITEFYIKGKLTYKELIFENLTKINYDKENTSVVKPFIIICSVLYELYKKDKAQAFLTKDECCKYLFDLQDYDYEKTKRISEKIIETDRSTSAESAAVLDIWFNAFGNFEIFSLDNRNVLKMNINDIDFFEFIYENGNKITHYNYTSEDSKYRNAYQELGSYSTGINEIIPEVVFTQREISNFNSIYNYIFGISNNDVDKFFIKDCFGIYKSFRFIKNIAIRKIWIKDKKIGDELFKINNKK